VKGIGCAAFGNAARILFSVGKFEGKSFPIVILRSEMDGVWQQQLWQQGQSVVPVSMPRYYHPQDLDALLSGNLMQLVFPVWLIPLWVYDNNDRLRCCQVGFDREHSIVLTNVVQLKNGQAGKVTEHRRKNPPTTVSRTPTHASAARASSDWKEKQQVDRYFPSETQPPINGAAAWRAQDQRRWPALCKKWEKCKPEELECTPIRQWIGQPKVDGDRCMIWLDMNANQAQGTLGPENIRLFSRNCLEMKFKNQIRTQAFALISHILRLWPTIGLFGLDGELRADVDFHQQSRSTVARTVNIDDVNENSLRFVWFDIISYDYTFHDRFNSMLQLWGSIDKSLVPSFILSDARYLSSPEEIQTYFNYAASIGYPEGIVLRRPHLMYTRKHEHKHSEMVKKKKLYDAEYRVIGFKSGEGMREGCVVWHCQDPRRPEIMFWCDQVGTLEHQRMLFNSAMMYYGRMLTVEYGSKSKDGVPLFPHGIRFRDLADLPPSASMMSDFNETISSDDD